MPRGPLPALIPGNGGLRHPRDHLQLHHEVRRRHQEGPVRQHRAVRRHHHVPRYRRQDAEGDHRPRPLHHQDQDHRSPREEVLRLDRRIHPGLPLHLPADVDLQAGVRRVRPIHCPPQVLLSQHSIITFCINLYCVHNTSYIHLAGVAVLRRCTVVYSLFTSIAFCLNNKSQFDIILWLIKESVGEEKICKLYQCSQRNAKTFAYK